MVEDLRSANYYPILTNGSTDSSVLEQEVTHTLYLSGGEPAVKFLSIETLDHTHTDGPKESIETAFQNIGMTPMYNYLTNLCIDGASVDNRIHNEQTWC